MLIDTTKSMLELVDSVRSPHNTAHTTAHTPPRTHMVLPRLTVSRCACSDGVALHELQRIAEDRERQRSKFGRVKPLWAIETKDDTSAKTMDELNSFDKQDIRGAYPAALTP